MLNQLQHPYLLLNELQINTSLWKPHLVEETDALNTCIGFGDDLHSPNFIAAFFCYDHHAAKTSFSQFATEIVPHLQLFHFVDFNVRNVAFFKTVVLKTCMF